MQKQLVKPERIKSSLTALYTQTMNCFMEIVSVLETRAVIVSVNV